MIGPDYGGPAFPRSGSEFIQPQEGMMLRDYFAAKAMHSLIAEDEDLSYGKSVISQKAYEMADAMLIERDKAVNVSKDSEIEALKRLLDAELDRSRNLGLALGGILVGAHDERATIDRNIIKRIKHEAVHVVVHPERGDVTAVYGGGI